MIYLFKGISNARTLGGIKSADGRKIKENMLYRTGELARAEEMDLDFLKRVGVKTVVDFRSLNEIEHSPDRSIEGAKYHAFPAIGGVCSVSEDVEKCESIRGIFAGVYGLLAASGEADAAYRGFLRLLLSAEGGVLWHCTQGKDRTGVAAILLLTVLGVPLEAAIDDYMLTNSCMMQEFEIMKKQGTPEETIGILKQISLVDRPLLDIYLDAIKARCGSLENYITDILGITDTEIYALRDKYLEW